ncbi:MAG: fibronectin type III domain-containing protein [Thermodesulfovibrionales bacterium]
MGWVNLGEFDPKVQEVCSAVLDAILAGKSNPSLNYNASIFGRIELAGHLAKNLVLSSSKLPTDTIPPSSPSNLTAKADSSTKVSLSWTASTDNIGVAGYKIYRNGVQVSTTSGTSHKDSGLLPSTVYTYTVKAYDAAGNISQPSNSISTKTNSNKIFGR